MCLYSSERAVKVYFILPALAHAKAGVITAMNKRVCGVHKLKKAVLDPAFLFHYF